MNLSPFLGALTGIPGVVAERMDEDPKEGAMIFRIRPNLSEPCRCGICGGSARSCDAGTVLCRWRAPNLGAAITYVEAELPKVECGEHGLVPAAVPWADCGSPYTKTFADTVARASAQLPKHVVSQLYRIPGEGGEDA